MKTFDFSVLMSVYKRELPTNLKQSLDSLLENQSLLPSQVVLVADGDLTEELDKVIAEFVYRYSDLIYVHRLSENLGLASALNEGLKYCRYEYVARMDSDDISLPNRFVEQMSYLQAHGEIDVLGAFIEEFDDADPDFSKVREVPVDQQSIQRFSVKRNPMSHPVVIFKKSAVLSVDGYPILYPEDHMLWLRMLDAGYIFHNLPQVLLKMRTGQSFQKRRGLKFLKGELAVIWYLVRSGRLFWVYAIYLSIVRILLRLSPGFLKVMLYKYCR